MHAEVKIWGRNYIVRFDAVKNARGLQDAIPARLDFFTKIHDDGSVTRFVITSLFMPDGSLVPAVSSLPHLPLMQEVLDTLEVIRASAH